MTTVATWDELEHAFEEHLANWEQVDYTNPFRKAEKDFEEYHENWFRTQTSPEGVPWPALSPVTEARKGSSQILVDTGRLQRSLTQSGPDAIREVVGEAFTPGFSFGTAVEYAMYHQLGAGLPERAHVGVNDQQIDSLCDDVADHLVGTFLHGPLN